MANLVLSILVVLSFNGYSKVKSPQNYLKLQKKYQTEKKDLSRIKKRIIKIEKQLNESNKSYISLDRKVIVVKKELDSIVVDLKVKREDIVKIKAQLRSLLTFYLHQSIDDTKTSEDLLLSKIALKKISLLKRKFKNHSAEIQALLSQAKVVENTLRDYKSNQRIILSLIKKLEQEKVGLTQDFISQKEGVHNLKGKLAKSKITRQVPRVLRKPFQLKGPLANFSDFKTGKKGVTYKFSGTRPVYAGHTGKISYIGRLANYGKIIIIDHGNDIRSVFLGNFKPKMKKGDAVVKGSIVGYTNPTAEDGTLYFEVRKKDIAENTIEWLDSKTSFKKGA